MSDLDGAGAVDQADVVLEAVQDDRAGAVVLDDDVLVLSSELQVFDEWHLDLESGDLVKISDRLYLGQVMLP